MEFRSELEYSEGCGSWLAWAVEAGSLPSVFAVLSPTVAGRTLPQTPRQQQLQKGGHVGSGGAGLAEIWPSWTIRVWHHETEIGVEL